MLSASAVVGDNSIFILDYGLRFVRVVVLLDRSNEAEAYSELGDLEAHLGVARPGLFDLGVQPVELTLPADEVGVCRRQREHREGEEGDRREVAQQIVGDRGVCVARAGHRSARMTLGARPTSRSLL